jgi:hypothetical protein
VCDITYILNTSVAKNKLFNSQVHKINTRQTSDLYLPSANLAMYQKGVYYSGIKVYNYLPTAIKVYIHLPAAIKGLQSSTNSH